MLRRIDLLAARRAAGIRALRRALPRARVDVREALAAVTPLVEAVAEQRLRRPPARPRCASTGSTCPSRGSPEAAFDAGAGRTRPGDPGRRCSSRSAGPGWCTRRSDARTSRSRWCPGGTVTQTWLPVERVGLYVPGGLAVYPSSVVMNVVPAQVAGVTSIAICSPAQKEFGGLPHPTILAACALLGVDEVYAVGGAQAVALLAYGDAALGIEPVDLITGPGNVYVAAAKRLVRGVVGIDAEAGPTEIAILADAGADPVARRGRPDQPGRARPAGRVRPGHRLAGAGRRGRCRTRAAGRR